VRRAEVGVEFCNWLSRVMIRLGAGGDSQREPSKHPSSIPCFGQRVAPQPYYLSTMPTKNVMLLGALCIHVPDRAHSLGLEPSLESRRSSVLHARVPWCWGILKSTKRYK
jgi:hypothetical protein